MPGFLDARSSRDATYRDYYLWRDAAPDGGPPNDLQSGFGGPAWTLDERTGQYHPHIFDARQPDLNWDNPAMRADIWAMMNRWLDRGIAGFRMNVIDLIGKVVDEGFVTDGPRLHDHLREMHRETLAWRDAVSVGETWSATPETALLYSGRERHELSMVFQFEHIALGHDEQDGKWRPKPVDLVALKRVLYRWQTALADDGWNSLFWGNHDLPRAVSMCGDDGAHRVRSAKLLATVLHLMKGTPYIYQGEELGMTNAGFTSIDQYRDGRSLDRGKRDLRGDQCRRGRRGSRPGVRALPVSDRRTETSSRHRRGRLPAFRRGRCADRRLTSRARSCPPGGERQRQRRAGFVQRAAGHADRGKLSVRQSRPEDRHPGPGHACTVGSVRGVVIVRRSGIAARRGERATRSEATSAARVPVPERSGQAPGRGAGAHHEAAGRPRVRSISGQRRENRRRQTPG